MDRFIELERIMLEAGLRFILPRTFTEVRTFQQLRKKWAYFPEEDHKSYYLRKINVLSLNPQELLFIFQKRGGAIKDLSAKELMKIFLTKESGKEFFLYSDDKFLVNYILLELAIRNKRRL